MPHFHSHAEIERIGRGLRDRSLPKSEPCFRSPRGAAGSTDLRPLPF